MAIHFYLWREDREIEPASDSLLERIKSDRNLPGIVRLSLPEIEAAFRRHFPDIVIFCRQMEWKNHGGSFKVSFKFDARDQPVSICISSEVEIHKIPEIFHRILEMAREIGCTRIESAIR